MTYHHKASNAQIFYDQVGIHISFLGSKLLIAWSEIEFYAITPALEKTNGEWQTYNQLPIEQVQLFEFKFAVKNRQHLLNKANIIMKSMLLFGFRLKPLLDANDSPTDHTGVFTFDVYPKTLKIAHQTLIGLITTQIKLDQLYDF